MSAPLCKLTPPNSLGPTELTTHAVHTVEEHSGPLFVIEQIETFTATRLGQLFE